MPETTPPKELTWDEIIVEIPVAIEITKIVADGVNKAKADGTITGSEYGTIIGSVAEKVGAVIDYFIAAANS